MNTNKDSPPCIFCGSSTTITIEKYNDRSWNATVICNNENEDENGNVGLSDEHIVCMVAGPSATARTRKLAIAQAVSYYRPKIIPMTYDESDDELDVDYLKMLVCK